MDKISEWRKYLEQETGIISTDDSAQEKYTSRKSTEGVDTERFKIRRAVPLSEIAPPREKPVLQYNSGGADDDSAASVRHSTTPIDDLPPPPAFLKIPGSHGGVAKPAQPQKQTPVVSQPQTSPAPADNQGRISHSHSETAQQQAQQQEQRQFASQPDTKQIHQQIQQQAHHKPEQSKPAPTMPPQPKQMQTTRTTAGKQVKGQPSPGFHSIIKTKKPPPTGSSREEILERLLNPTITLDEAAVVMGVCKATIRRYTEKGILPCYRTPGNQRRFKLNEVLMFMEDLKNNGAK